MKKVFNNTWSAKCIRGEGLMILDTDRHSLTHSNLNFLLSKAEEVDDLSGDFNLVFSFKNGSSEEYEITQNFE